MKSVLAIRHVSFEDLGAFAPVLHEAGYAIDYWDVGEHDLEELDAAGADLLIVLGGPIAAYEDSTYPFLRTELEILEQRLASSAPTIGICLGAQLLARAAGARVYPGAEKEIGFAPITLTDAGRRSCLAPFAEAPTTLHWHGDTFDLPADTERLASSPICENQAFSLGRNVIGFQFHPEASAPGFEKWLVGHAAELAAAGIDVTALRASAERCGLELETKARVVISDWLAQIDA